MHGEAMCPSGPAPDPPLSAIGRVIQTMFRVIDKQGVEMDFVLNPSQRKLDARWTRRNVIPKARQMGFSTYIIARFVAKCLGLQNRRTVIISHDREATAKLLERARFFADHLRDGQGGYLPPEIGRNNRGELEFRKTNSTLYIGTAGSRNFGRGDTITDLHCSELASWRDAERLMRGLIPAAKAGEITIESTGNGVGNYYHRLCKRAEEGKGYTLHFFPFTEMAEYTLPFTSARERDAFMALLNPDWEEDKLVAMLTAEQLHWRRMTLLDDFDGDLHSFKAEYPTTLDECFQSTGYGFFQKVNYQPTPKWERESRFFHKLDGHPWPNYQYVIGADVGAGVGRDSSVAEIVCLDTMEQVGEYASNGVAPDEFGTVLDGLGRRFNMAYINPEQNNHGLTTIAQLRATYPNHLIHRTHSIGSPNRDVNAITAFGSVTTEVSRARMIGLLKKNLAGDLIIHSSAMKGELDTFVETEKGKVEAEVGCNDDRVMALGAASMALETGAMVLAGTTPSRNRPKVPSEDFTLDGMLAYLERTKGFKYDREYPEDPDENFTTLQGW